MQAAAHGARLVGQAVAAGSPAAEVLAETAVVIGSPACDRLAAIAAEHGVWLVVGVNEREKHGATIYNTVLYFSPAGGLAGPVRGREQTLVLDLDLRAVAAARRYLDPVGHYHRPDVFRLYVDISPRRAVIETDGGTR